MTKAVMLDSGPLGRIAHPRPNREIADWLEGLLSSGVAVIIPEIPDYEVRRNLLLERLTKSVERFDRLKDALIYQPLTTDVMLRAAEMWAEARRTGKPLLTRRSWMVMSFSRLKPNKRAQLSRPRTSVTWGGLLVPELGATSRPRAWKTQTRTMTSKLTNSVEIGMKRRTWQAGFAARPCRCIAT